jgi:hypothetical protein
MRSDQLVLKILMALISVAFVACAPSGDRTPSGQNQTLEGCDLTFRQNGYCARFIWENTPTSTEVGTFYLEFYSLEAPGQLITPPGNLSVFYRPVGGTAPAKNTTVILTNPGQYRVEPLVLETAGRWEIHIQLRNQVVAEDEIFYFNRL